MNGVLTKKRTCASRKKEFIVRLHAGQRLYREGSYSMTKKQEALFTGSCFTIPTQVVTQSINVYIVEIFRLRCQVMEKNALHPKTETLMENVFIYIDISFERERKDSGAVHRAQIYFQISNFCLLYCIIWAHHKGSRHRFLHFIRVFSEVHLTAHFIKWLTFCKLMTYRHKGICVFCLW